MRINGRARLVREVPFFDQIAQRFERLGEALEDVQRYYGPPYTADLYRDNPPQTGKDLNRAGRPAEH